VLYWVYHSFTRCSPAGGSVRHPIRNTVSASAAGIAPGRWLGTPTVPTAADAVDDSGPPVYGVELTAEQWDPLGLSGTVMQVRAMPLQRAR
jgi:hypothetical protein